MHNTHSFVLHCILNVLKSIYPLISAFKTATSNLAEWTIKRHKATVVQVPSVHIDSSGFVTYQKTFMNLSDYIRHHVHPYCHMATEGQQLEDMDTIVLHSTPDYLPLSGTFPYSPILLLIAHYYYKFVTCLIAHHAPAFQLQFMTI